MRDLNPNFFPNLELERPMIISGPCSAESEEQLLSTAHQLSALGVKIFRAGVWKPRTKPGGFEGVGKLGLEWMQRVRRETGMLISVEVATPVHVQQALEADMDMLWIGARTSANPFAMQDIADALKGVDIPILVKNPVSPDLDLWMGAMQRLRNAGITRLGAIHRGFSSYGDSLYRNQPIWSIPIELHRQFPNMPIICDPSHMGGKRSLIEPLTQQAMDLGFSGVMIESHCNPEAAWSDAAQQLTPCDLGDVLSRIVIRDKKVSTQDLSDLRREIDELDGSLLELLAKRMKISRSIGIFKKEHDMPILQATRYDEILEKRGEQAASLGLDLDFVKDILQSIHEASVELQIKINSEE
ncbi:MAG: bifunctional 3-deoxy-7-phosphoheptulonate synthase/chorismate mutase type II [Rikenellaceae bacterium]